MRTTDLYSRKKHHKTLTYVKTGDILEELKKSPCFRLIAVGYEPPARFAEILRNCDDPSTLEDLLLEYCLSFTDIHSQEQPFFLIVLNPSLDNWRVSGFKIFPPDWDTDEFQYTPIDVDRLEELYEDVPKPDFFENITGN